MKNQGIKYIILLMVLITIILYIRIYFIDISNINQLSFLTDTLCLIFFLVAYFLKIKRRILIYSLVCFSIIFSPIDLYEGISNNKILYLFRQGSYFNYNYIYPVTLLTSLFCGVIIVIESLLVIIRK